MQPSNYDLIEQSNLSAAPMPIPETAATAPAAEVAVGWREKVVSVPACEQRSCDISNSNDSIFFVILRFPQ